MKHPDQTIGDNFQNDNIENLAAKLLAPLQFNTDYRPSEEASCLMEWLNGAITLPGKSPIRMALLLTQLSMKLGRTKYLLVTQAMLTEVSISRVSAYEALKELESAGLVKVDRCQGKSPRVSIIRSCQ